MPEKTIDAIAVCPISNEEAARLGIPDSILAGAAGRQTAGRQLGELDSEFQFLIHVPISSEVVATFGAEHVGVRLLGFGKLQDATSNDSLHREAL